MIKNMYGIYDRVAKLFSYMYEAVNDEMANRTFQNEARNENSALHLNPEDYELWKLGNYELENGHYTEELYKLTDARGDTSE